MNRFLIPGIALLAAACASDPQYVWSPTDPAFGHDQAITQNAFCENILQNFADISKSKDDRKKFEKMTSAAEARVVSLWKGPVDEKARQDGKMQSLAYIFSGNPNQMIAAGRVCVDVINKS